MSCFHKEILFCLFLFLGVSVQAQFPSGSSSNFPQSQRQSGNQSSGQSFVSEPDTFGVFLFYADNPDHEIPFTDSLLHNFEEYNPIRQRDLELAFLGNLGSATRQLFYQPRFTKGLDVGFHQFDLYMLNPEQTPYYRLKRAFTRVYYSQGESQQDIIFKGEFSRNFSDGINLSINYIRYNNEGKYKSQQAKNVAFVTNLWYNHPGGKYDGYLSFNSNTVRQEDNGGIILQELNANNTQIPFTVPVYLDNGIAQTRHTHREFSYIHSYNLAGIPERGYQSKKKTKEKNNPAIAIPRPDADTSNINFTKPAQDTIQSDSMIVDSIEMLQPDRYNGKMDSIQKTSYLDSIKSQQTTLPDPVNLRKRAYSLTHQFSFKRNTYKFADTSPDTGYYDHLVLHKLGLRHYLEHKKLENTFRISTSKSRTHNKVKTQQDLLEVGLSHSLNVISQEPNPDSTIHNVFLHGRWHFSPSERLKVQTYAHLGLVANAGDYRLSGDLFFDFKQFGNLNLKVINQAFAPGLIHDKYYISKQLLWDNSFNKTFETSLAATYALPSLKMEVSGQLHLINNYIYFDTLSLPQQIASAISVGQLIIKKDFKVGPFHLDNTVILQQNSSDVLRLPEIYLKHSLYFEGKIFKKRMFTRIGVDFRMNTDFIADNYQPLTGQFHLQDQFTATLYPLLDAFINVKVGNFRFFAKQENLARYFRNDFYFLTMNYPYPYASFRFGISWKFLD